MEFSQISLNNSLTFLAYVSGVIILLVGGFLTKLLIDFSKLTKNVDETTTIVKKEIEPTLKELNESLHAVNNLMKNTDQRVDKLKKSMEDIFGLSASAFSKAKFISGSMLKGIFKGFSTMVKLFSK